MPRDFDGTDDRIAFGTDASIADYVLKGLAVWIFRDGNGFMGVVAKQTDTNVWGMFVRGPGGGGNRLAFIHSFSGGNGTWDTVAGISTSTRTHVAVSYDNSSVSNAPSLYINGVLQTLNLNVAPIGTPNSESALPMSAGEWGTGSSDFDGRIAHLNYDDGLIDAAAVNRAMWWGRARGGLQVYHPWVTDKLTNEGSATANGSATGTTMGVLVTPVVRPCTAMMGLGVGW